MQAAGKGVCGLLGDSVRRLCYRRYLTHPFNRRLLVRSLPPLLLLLLLRLRVRERAFCINK